MSKISVYVFVIIWILRLGKRMQTCQLPLQLLCIQINLTQLVLSCMQKTFVKEYYDDQSLKRGIIYKRQSLFRIYMSFTSTACIWIQVNQINKKIVVHVTCNSVNRKQPLYVNNFKQTFKSVLAACTVWTSTIISLQKTFALRLFQWVRFTDRRNKWSYYLLYRVIILFVCFC